MVRDISNWLISVFMHNFKTHDSGSNQQVMVKGQLRVYSKLTRNHSCYFLIWHVKGYMIFIIELKSQLKNILV